MGAMLLSTVFAVLNRLLERSPMNFVLKPQSLPEDNRYLIDASGATYEVHGGVTLGNEEFLGTTLEFDGSGAIRLPPHRLPTGDTLSVSFWAAVAADGVKENNSIMNATRDGEAAAEGNTVFGVGIPFNGKIRFSAGHKEKKNTVVKRLADNELKADQWIHWAFTKDAKAGVMTIWRNGQKWFSQDKQIRGVLPHKAFTLGGAFDGDNVTLGFKGKIAQLRVSDRVEADVAYAKLFSLCPERFSADDSHVVDEDDREFEIVGDVPGLGFDKYFGACLEFSGEPTGSNAVRLPKEAMPDTQELTISFWEKPNSVSHSTTAFEANMDGEATTPANLVAGIHLPWKEPLKGEVRFDCGTDGTAVDSLILDVADDDLNVGEWTHWAFTKKITTVVGDKDKTTTTGEMAIFRNGLPWPDATKGVLKNATKRIGSPGSVMLGASMTGDNGFDGSIAQFCVFGSALTQKQIFQSNPALANLYKVTGKSPELVAKLVGVQLFSCLPIANMTEKAFLDEYAAELGDVSKATDIYRRAKDVKSQLSIYFMGSSEQAGHYRSMPSDNQSAGIDDKYQHLPSYRELFQATEFCEVDESHSIFSPAAYLVDLMRFKQNNIDDNNVPGGFKLEERRPDLADLLLTPKNTTTEVPKLEIVNRVFEDQVLREEKDRMLQSPVLHLPLNGNVVDRSLRHAQIKHSGPLEFVPGPFEGSLGMKFGGKTLLGTDPLHLGDAYSIAVWVKVSKDDGGAIFAVEETLTALGYNARKTFGAADEFFDGRLFFVDLKKLEIAAVSNVLPVDKWCHVVVAASADDVHLFVDGEAFDGPSLKSAPAQGAAIDAPVQIGYGFNGRLAELRVYNKALSPDEVGELPEPAKSPGEAAKLRAQVVEKFYEDISHTMFPTSLPFHCSLEQVRANLATLHASLPEVWRTFGKDASLPTDTAARELLGLTPAEWELFTKDDEGDDEFVRTAYGLDADPPLDKVLEKLSRVEVFTRQTRLSSDQVRSLVYGDLSDDEIADGEQEHFYINADDPGAGAIRLDGARGVLSNDTNGDPQPLTALKFRRLCHVMRLAKATGWSYADVDWALRCAGSAAPAGSMAGMLMVLAQVRQWVDTYEIAVDDACALLSLELRSFGKKNGDRFYDRLFGLHEMTAKDERDLLKWAGNFKSKKDGVPPRINAWLMAGLRVSADDLLELAWLVLPRSPRFEDKASLLTVMYRVVVLARMLNRSVRDTAALIGMLHDHANVEPRERTGIVGTDPQSAIDGVRRTVAFANTLTSVSVDVPTLQYVVAADGPAQSTLSLHGPVVANFLKTLREALRRSLHKAASAQTAAGALKPVQRPGKSLPLRPEWVDADGIVISTPADDCPSSARRSENAGGEVPAQIVKQGEVQRRTLDTHLASLFGVTPDVMSVARCWALPDRPVSEILHVLLASAEISVQAAAGVEAVEVHDDVSHLLGRLNQCCVLIKALGIVRPEIVAFMTHRQRLGAHHESFDLQMDTVEQLIAYKFLQKRFVDPHHVLVNSLLSGKFGDGSAFARLTRWREEDLLLLCNKVLGLKKSEVIGKKHKLSVPALCRIAACFSLASKLRLSVNGMLELAQLEGNPEYAAYQPAADALLSAVKVKYRRTDWKTVYQPIKIQFLEKQRDALMPYIMQMLQRQGIPVHTPKDLYEYLLIDVEVAGTFPTSVVKEALGCLQLYVYRCRMQMEAGVELSDEIDQFWEWVKNYRVWEANRKVFLYPENYTEPELRKDKTPLFDKLTQGLQQGHLDEETVDKAVKVYLDGFAEVANLKTAGAYLVNSKDPGGSGHPEKTLYLVGHTSAKPYQHYYRSANFGYDGNREAYAPTEWDPWTKIELGIHSQLVTPVFAFGKPFVFWAEIKPAPAARDAAADNKPSTAKDKRFEAQLQYSFHRFGKNWVAPQPLGEPIPLPDNVTEYQQVDNSDLLQRVGVHVQTGTAGTKDETLVVGYPTDGAMNLWGATGVAVRLALDELLQVEKLSPVGLPTAPLDVKKKGANDAIAKTPEVSGPGFTAFITQTGGFQVSGPFAPAGKDEIKGSIFTRHFNPEYLYIEIDVTEPMYLEYVEFTHGQNNGKPATYNIFLEIGGESGDFKRLDGTKFVASKQTNNEHCRLPVNKLLAVGKHRLRWFPDPAPEAAAYFALNDIVLALGPPMSALSPPPKALTKLPAATKGCPVVGGAPWSLLDTGSAEYLVMPTEANADAVHCIRLNSTTTGALSRDLFADGIEGLLTVDAQKTPEDSFVALAPDRKLVLQPWPSDTLDFNSANGIYYRELFFHTPFLVANNLTTAQQFEMAQKWYHFIFNPTMAGAEHDGDPSDRFWRFLGLRAALNPILDGEHRMTPAEELEADLGSGPQITRYYEDPFDPHAIAELRPIAYQKTVVMHYIDNLIQWADSLFRQDTRETLVEAELLYVLAYDLLGKKPKDVGACLLPPPERLGELLRPYSHHDIPEFLVGLEQSLVPDPRLNARDNPNNEIPGSYFGIPENEKFTGYWDTVRGRLFNLRHYLTIDGQPQHLALFQPPIDPAELVAAIASGAGVAEAVGDMSAPMPHYRFSVLIEKAKQTTQTVIQFGSALQTALEKQDAEHLSRLKSTHEQALLKLSVASKTDELNAANSSLTVLQKNLAAAKQRRSHFQALIANGPLVGEILQLALETEAIVYNTDAQVVKAASIAGYLVPTIFGFSDGDLNPGEAVQQGAGIAEGTANVLSQAGQLAGSVAQNTRRLEDWNFQLDNAKAEVDQLTEQVKGAQLRVQIAQAGLDYLNKTIDQAAEVELFLKAKFTTTELYQWLVGRLSALYFQAYQVSCAMAVSAQRAWQFERVDKTEFVHAGAWDDLHRGLLAGETLLLDLQTMEQSYLEKDKRALEVVKTVSLKRHCGERFHSDLKNRNSLKFEFKRDSFPEYRGDARRIKSVNISIPALVGPYQNVHATLEQIECNPPSGRSGEKVVISQGVGDTGMFDFNYRDERYLPFEGTSTESTWQITFVEPDKGLDPNHTGKKPDASPADFADNLTDIVFEMRYLVLQDQ